MDGAVVVARGRNAIVTRRQRPMLEAVRVRVRVRVRVEARQHARPAHGAGSALQCSGDGSPYFPAGCALNW